MLTALAVEKKEKGKFLFTVPHGVTSGEMFRVSAGNRFFNMKCPPNHKSGQKLQFSPPPVGAESFCSACNVQFTGKRKHHKKTQAHKANVNAAKTSDEVVDGQREANRSKDQKNLKDSKKGSTKEPTQEHEYGPLCYGNRAALNTKHVTFHWPHKRQVETIATKPFDLMLHADHVVQVTL